MSVGGVLRGNMRRALRKLELLANVAVILVAVMFAVIFVQRYLRPPPSGIPARKPPPTSESLVGKQISLSGVDWKTNGKTIVLALQTRCHFCTESASFYQNLVKEKAKQANVHLVAVLPDAVQESEGYLKSLGISVDAIIQAPLNSVGIRGTPTVLMVDDTGTIRRAWLGRLDADRERDVIGTLHAKS